MVAEDILEERHGVVEGVEPGERLVVWWRAPSRDGSDAAPAAPGPRVACVLDDDPGGTRVTETATGPWPLAAA